MLVIMQANVDLRVVLLLRDPLALLASAVLKRQFVDSLAVGMEVALRNFEVMLQQLLLLDPVSECMCVSVRVCVCVFVCRGVCPPLSSPTTATTEGGGGIDSNKHNHNNHDIIIIINNNNNKHYNSTRATTFFRAGVHPLHGL